MREFKSQSEYKEMVEMQHYKSGMGKLICVPERCLVLISPLLTRDESSELVRLLSSRLQVQPLLLDPRHVGTAMCFDGREAYPGRYPKQVWGTEMPFRRL